MQFVRPITAALLAVFLLLGTLSYVAALQSEHAGMASDAHQLCPLMGVTPACANLLDSLGHWQNFFTPALTLLALATVLPALFAFLLPRIRRRSLQPHTRTQHPTLYEQLFARGILNPKAP